MQGQEMTIMSNVFSLLQELGSLLKGDDAPIEETVEEPIDDMTGENMAMDDVEVEEGMGLMDEDTDDKDMVAKGLEETPSDGSVANDDAEERVEEPLPEESADNVDKVAKAVLGLINGTNRKTVKKSVDTDTNRVLGEVAQVMKSLVAKQQIQEKAMVNLIDGLGVAKDIERQYGSEQKVQKGLNNTNDIEKTLNYLAKSLQKNETPNTDYSTNGNEVRKSVSSFIKQIQQANGKY